MLDFLSAGAKIQFSGPPPQSNTYKSLCADVHIGSPVAQSLLAWSIITAGWQPCSLQPCKVSLLQKYSVSQLLLLTLAPGALS